MSEIVPYKNRVYDLDYKQPVEVYRNTNRKGVTYSIRQGGYVVAHATELHLLNAEFIVNKYGNTKVRTTGKKNVHAWVRGELVKKGLVQSENSNLQARVLYNPKYNETFVTKKNKKPIQYAPAVILNSEGVFVDDSVNL